MGDRSLTREDFLHDERIVPKPLFWVAPRRTVPTFDDLRTRYAEPSDHPPAPGQRIDGAELHRSHRRRARRHLNHRGAQSNPLRACRRRSEEHFRRRGMRVLVEEMVLDLPGVVETETVGEFHLVERVAQQLVLVVSAPNEDDKNLRELHNEVALAPEAFADHDMALVTLLDNAVSTAGDRVLTTEEAAAACETLGIRPGSFALRLIGKDGLVKLSNPTATSMTEIYSLIDSMPMRQREMTDRQ